MSSLVEGLGGELRAGKAGVQAKTRSVERGRRPSGPECGKPLVNTYT